MENRKTLCAPSYTQREGRGAQAQSADDSAETFAEERSGDEVQINYDALSMEPYEERRANTPVAKSTK